MGRGRKNKDIVKLDCSDIERIRHSLDLDRVVGDKPCINAVMPKIVARMDEEERLRMLEMASRWRGMIYGDDDYLDYYEGRYNCKKGKKGKRGRKKRGNLGLIYGYGSEDVGYEDVESSYKLIKFYDNIENEFTAREFHSIKEFNDFCDEKGYYVSTVDHCALIDNKVIHCCLDPVSKSYGEDEIITDTSYGGLYWTVSGDLSKYGDEISANGGIILNR